MNFLQTKYHWVHFQSVAPIFVGGRYDTAHVSKKLISYQQDFADLLEERVAVEIDYS